MSHALRDEVRARTLQDFARFGIEPLVSRQEKKPSALHNRLNARAAIGLARPFAGPVLFCEDDLILADTLPQWLEHCQRINRVAYLYVSKDRHYPAHLQAQIARGQELEPGLYELALPERIYGSQCIYLPQYVLEGMWRDKLFTALEPYIGPFDHYLRGYLQRIGHRPLCAAPNCVQHQAPPRLVRQANPHTSTTFRRKVAPKGVSYAR